MIHRDSAALNAGLDAVRSSPTDVGRLELVVARPALGEREVLESAELTFEHGLLGDNWDRRPSRRTPDGSPNPDMQLNVVNSRFSALISSDLDHRVLVGDQLHVDLDLSVASLPPGSRLAIGSAVIEVTEQPHLGCAKFTRRFGADAARLVTSELGRALRLRGLNAKVVVAGSIRRDDEITKLPTTTSAPA